MVSEKVHLVEGVMHISIHLLKNVVLIFLFINSSIYAQTSGNSGFQSTESADSVWVRHYNSGQLPGRAQFSDMVLDNQGNVYCTGAIRNLVTGEDYMTIKYDATGVEQWRAIYNGPGSSYDKANCIALDGDGNVFVSGVSNGGETYSDYATIKYNASGEEQWVARYDGPTSEASDDAYAMAIDDSGNVYVTGGSDSYSSEDYATIKYNSDGEEQWVKRYDGPASEGSDRAKYLVLDEAGNIYITGESEGNSSKGDFATIKYTPDGTMLWATRYDAAYSQKDQPGALAVDDFGNVYVTGSSVNTSYKWGYATVKYNLDGVEQWATRYDGPAGSNDNAKGLVVDDSGYVYVTGNSYDNTNYDDFTTVKYGPDGQEKWVVRYNSGEKSSDRAHVITLDADGNIYVAGQSEGAAIVKYNSAGEQLWKTNYESVYKINALRLDNAGNIYLIGNSSSYEQVCAAVKFNNQGVEEWDVIQEGPGLGYEHPEEIALDDNGNIYVAGYTQNPETGLDFSLIKYDTSGTEQWVAFYNGPDSGSDQGMAMVIDNQGNIYMTGSSSVFGSDTDWATVKFNSEGIQQWAARFDGGNKFNDVAVDIAVDAAGNVFVTGHASQNTNTFNYDFATIKYNSSGTEKWVAFYDGPASTTDEAKALALDDSGYVYVTGYSAGSTTGNDFTTIKYDQDGNEKWVARYNGPGNDNDIPTDVAVDRWGKINVCGASTGDGTGFDYTIVQYNSAGVEQWVQRYNGAGNGWDWPTDMAIGSDGRVFITGYIKASSGYNDMLTIKYNQAGVFQWSSTYDGPAYSNDKATGLSLGIDDVVYVTGVSQGHDESYDYATHKINKEGYRDWVMRYNSKNDNAVAVIADDKGKFYVTGFTLFDNDTESRATTIKYSDPTVTGLSGEFKNLPQLFNLGQNYPNPFNPSTTIRYQLIKSGLVDLSIFSVLGQKVATLVSKSQPAGEYLVSWDATKFSSGLYYYKLKTETSERTYKMHLIR
jgi:uncharacterized delta-60 repeat protein